MDSGRIFMQPAVLQYINDVWGLVAIYWIVGMVLAKPTIKSESILSSTIHIVVGCVAVLLVWDPATGTGVLGHRLTPLTGWVAWLGLAVTIGGCAFAVWARATLGSNWSSLVTVKQDHELILRGPYAVVRHPIYSGLLLALTGTAIAVGEVRAFVGLGLAFIGFLLKSAAEEKFMREEFSTEYARYSQRVKRLIPFVY
jgi:protein-S-isoprenylcysteine O-methyltransferase Ste14